MGARVACNPRPGPRGPMRRRAHSQGARAMADELKFRTTKLLTQTMRRFVAMSTLATSIIACSLAAQQQGPLPTPPASDTSQPAPPTQSASPAPAPAAKPQTDSAGSSHGAPAIPGQQIIQKFGDRELEFKKERAN